MDDPTLNPLTAVYQNWPTLGLILGLASWIWPKYLAWRKEEKERKKEEDKRLERDILVRQRANVITKCRLKIDMALLKFLKESGYDIDVPDLMEEI